MEVKSIQNQDEINKLLDLFIRVFSEPPYEEVWTRESAFKRLSEIYERGKDFCLYIEQNRQIIGMIFCQIQTWQDGIHVIIEDVVVDSKQRNKGIGALLVKKIEEIAKEKNITSIDLLSNTKSKAVDFWKKQGYETNGYVQFMKRIENSTS